MKLCKDCKHYKYYNKCTRKIIRTSPVTGEVLYEYASCERTPWNLFDKIFGFGWDTCGAKAKFFEEKE